MPRYFAPVDDKTHERANRGDDIADRCRWCGLDFMEHINGRCPTAAELEREEQEREWEQEAHERPQEDNNA